MNAAELAAAAVRNPDDGTSPPDAAVIEEACAQAEKLVEVAQAGGVLRRRLARTTDRELRAAVGAFLDAFAVVDDDAVVTFVRGLVRVAAPTSSWLHPEVAHHAAIAKLAPFIDSPELERLLTLPPYVDENVQFTVYRPRVVAPAVWVPFIAYAHLAEARPGEDGDPIEQVRQDAARVLGAAARDYQDVSQDSRLAVPVEGELTFVPEIAGIEFNPPRASFVWLEPVHRADFRMRADPNLDGKTARGRMSVFLGHILIAEVSLQIKVERGRAASVDTAPAEHARPYRKIFASYSHRDTAVVEELERYARAIGDEYIRDWIHLRTGEIWGARLEQMIEQADVFQLFWSSASMHSKFVRQEWEHALSLDRPSFVRPLYWEVPMPTAPGLPPERLSQIHFQRLGGAPAKREAVRGRVLWRDREGRDGALDLDPQGTVFVGRGAECAIRTDDAMVSRRHAQIRFDGQRYVIEDLGSANGTLVNGQRIQKQALGNSDMIQCGPVTIRFVEDDGAPPGGEMLPGAARPGPAAMRAVPTAVPNDERVKVRRAVAMSAQAAEMFTSLADLLSSLRIEVMAAGGELDQLSEVLPRPSFELIRHALQESGGHVDSARDLVRAFRELDEPITGPASAVAPQELSKLQNVVREQRGILESYERNITTLNLAIDRLKAEAKLQHSLVEELQRVFASLAIEPVPVDVAATLEDASASNPRVSRRWAGPLPPILGHTVALTALWRALLELMPSAKRVHVTCVDGHVVVTIEGEAGREVPTMCRAIVAVHRGRLDIESADAITRVIVTLPARATTA